MKYDEYDFFSCPVNYTREPCDSKCGLCWCDAMTKENEKMNEGMKDENERL